MIFLMLLANFKIPSQWYSGTHVLRLPNAPHCLLKLFNYTCWPQSIFMSEKLISPFSSILSRIIRFMCSCGLNRGLGRSVSLLLSALKSVSLGPCLGLGAGWTVSSPLVTVSDSTVFCCVPTPTDARAL